MTTAPYDKIVGIGLVRGLHAAGVWESESKRADQTVGFVKGAKDYTP